MIIFELNTCNLEQWFTKYVSVSHLKNIKTTPFNKFFMCIQMNFYPKRNKLCPNSNLVIRTNLPDTAKLRMDWSAKPLDPNHMDEGLDAIGWCVAAFNPLSHGTEKLSWALQNMVHLHAAEVLGTWNSSKLTLLL